jgi:hypothetical protein
MRLTLSVALSFALIAAPAAAQGPCDILAAAINARFEAGMPVGPVVDALAQGSFRAPQVEFPASRDSAIAYRDPPANPQSDRREYELPHLRGSLLVTHWDGSLNCQVLDLYRIRNGRPQFVRGSGVDKLGGGCLDAEVRPASVGGKPYLIDVPSRPGQSAEAGDEVRIGIHPLTRAGVTAQGACAVALRMGPRARIEDLQPADAASVQARRAAMAALEPAMARLAQAYADRYAHLYEFESLPDAELRRDPGSDISVRFKIGAADYIARMGAEGSTRDALAVRLARIWPELGGRERELATFRYALSRAFLGALSIPSELR